MLSGRAGQHRVYAVRVALVLRGATLAGSDGSCSIGPGDFSTVVSCGGHYAGDCAACTQGHGGSWCNGECKYLNGECVAKADVVSCGGHEASSCAQCPAGNGANWCNGDCEWQADTCVAKLTAAMLLRQKVSLAHDPRQKHGTCLPQSLGTPEARRNSPGLHFTVDWQGAKAGNTNFQCTNVKITQGAQSISAAASCRVEPIVQPLPTAEGSHCEGFKAAACHAGTASEPALRLESSFEKVPAHGEAAPPLWGTSEDAWSQAAAEVRAAFLRAWKGYQRHAWGADELKPISCKGSNTFGNIGVSILDSLTTLWLLNLPEEFETAAAFVEKDLDFGRGSQPSSVFEVTIRALGGLLGAHSLSGRPAFLRRAWELASLLLPAFNTTSGLPVPDWNLRKKHGSNTCGQATVLAQAGSLQIEWRYLAGATGDNRLKEAVDGAFEAIQATGVTGLLPSLLTPPGYAPPQVLASKFTVGGEADSYYEYLLKQWIQSPEETRFKDLFLKAMDELHLIVRPAPSTEKQRYKLIEVDAHGNPAWKMEHLSCFVPGMIALALMQLPAKDTAPRSEVWTALAEGLMESCVALWTETRSGLAPEHVSVSPQPPHEMLRVPQDGKHALLRPETVESLYYMYRLTNDTKYRVWGRQIFNALLAHASTEAGFSSVANVNRVPTTKVDRLHSFVFAETFKYLYLLFAPPSLLDLNKFVLNTEGHPLRIRR